MVPRARLRAMTRVAIIAAMPGELKPLVHGWPHSKRGTIHFWAQRTEEEEWIAACAGAGQDAATRAFAGIEDGGPIDLVFSVGWAGALRAGIEPGAAYNVAGVVDVRTGERFNCDAEAGEIWLVTSHRVCDEDESRRTRPSGHHARNPVLLHQGSQRQPHRPPAGLQPLSRPRRPSSTRPPGS